MNYSHFVYIVYSESSDKYYKGYSLDPSKRLLKHNNGASCYTRQFRPWKLIYVEGFTDKKTALRREVGLKKYSKLQIKDLLPLPRNLVNEF